MTAFVNGVSGAPTTKTGYQIGTNAASLLVAQLVAYAKFKGDIALIRIYNGTALTPAQVQQNWEAEKWRINDAVVTLPTPTATADDSPLSIETGVDVSLPTPTATADDSPLSIETGVDVSLPTPTAQADDSPMTVAIEQDRAPYCQHRRPLRTTRRWSPL